MICSTQHEDSFLNSSSCPIPIVWYLSTTIYLKVDVRSEIGMLLSYSYDPAVIILGTITKFFLDWDVNNVSVLIL
jgi:hypothetical protein